MHMQLHTHEAYRHIWKCAYFATTKQELVNGWSHTFMLTREGGRAGIKRMLVLENIWDGEPNCSWVIFYLWTFQLWGTTLPFISYNECDSVSFKIIGSLKDTLLVGTPCFSEGLMITVVLFSWTSNAEDGLCSNKNLSSFKNLNQS